MEITEPVPRGLESALRQAVLEHAAAERRRSFVPTLWVGVPGLVRHGHQLDASEHYDHALRTDVVEAMVRRARRPGPIPLVWLTRPGPLDVQDVDLGWLAAVRTAAAELATRLPMVVVDRRSWRDPRSGVGRTWQRLRQR